MKHRRFEGHAGNGHNNGQTQQMTISTPSPVYRGTVSSLPGTLSFRIKLCHSTGIARSVVGAGPAQQAMLSEGSDPANPPNQTFELNLFKKKSMTIYSPELLPPCVIAELPFPPTWHGGFVHLPVGHSAHPMHRIKLQSNTAWVKVKVTPLSMSTSDGRSEAGH